MVLILDKECTQRLPLCNPDFEKRLSRVSGDLSLGLKSGDCNKGRTSSSVASIEPHLLKPPFV